MDKRRIAKDWFMTYAFWISADSEAHARQLCSDNGLTMRIFRKAPQMKHPTRVRPMHPHATRNHVQGEIFHCRAIKECATPEEATALNDKIGVGAVLPEEAEAHGA